MPFAGGPSSIALAICQVLSPPWKLEIRHCEACFLDFVDKDNVLGDEKSEGRNLGPQMWSQAACIPNQGCFRGQKYSLSHYIVGSFCCNRLTFPFTNTHGILYSTKKRVQVSLGNNEFNKSTHTSFLHEFSDPLI